MKAVLGLIGIGIFLAMMGGIMASMQTATTASRIDSFGVTSNISATTLTLQEAPWQGLTASITLITSNVSTDHPLAQTVSGKQLAVTGLDDTAGARALSVNYEYSSMEGYAGGSTMPNLTPLLIWIGVILVIIGIGVGIFRHQRGG